ncbi:MAG: hypothetical protein WBA46_14330 [Thermomicrobiales bacterium]
MSAKKQEPTAERAEFGNLSQIRAYVTLGPIPIPGAPRYGARIIRLPTQRQVRRMLQRAALGRPEGEGSHE